MLEVIGAKRWFKCRGCGEQIRTDEKYVQILGRKSERYCLECEGIAIENNADLELSEPDTDNDGERHLRQMEDYAAYRAAGCTEEYWSDRDNGYCH